MDSTVLSLLIIICVRFLMSWHATSQAVHFFVVATRLDDSVCLRYLNRELKRRKTTASGEFVVMISAREYIYIYILIYTYIIYVYIYVYI